MRATDASYSLGCLGSSGPAAATSPRCSLSAGERTRPNIMPPQKLKVTPGVSWQSTRYCAMFPPYLASLCAGS